MQTKTTIIVAAIAASLVFTPAQAAGLQQTGGVLGGQTLSSIWNGFRSWASPTFRAQQQNRSLTSGQRSAREVDSGLRDGSIPRADADALLGSIARTDPARAKALRTEYNIRNGGGLVAPGTRYTPAPAQKRK